MAYWRSGITENTILQHPHSTYDEKSRNSKNESMCSAERPDGMHLNNMTHWQLKR